MCRSEQPLSSRVPLKPRKCQVEVLMQEKHSDASCVVIAQYLLLLFTFFFFFCWGAYHLHETFAWPCAACLDSIYEEEIKRAPFQQLTTALNGVCPLLNLKGRKKKTASLLHLKYYYYLFFLL